MLDKDYSTCMYLNEFSKKNTTFFKNSTSNLRRKFEICIPGVGDSAPSVTDSPTAGLVNTAKYKYKNYYFPLLMQVSN